MCLHVSGLLSLVLGCSVPSTETSAFLVPLLLSFVLLCFSFIFELFQLNSCSSFACGQNCPSVNISTPNTHLGMLQITNRGYYEARGGRE